MLYSYRLEISGFERASDLSASPFPLAIQTVASPPLAVMRRVFSGGYAVHRFI